MTANKSKSIHIGAPECFALEREMLLINEAFGVHASYVVGSSLDRRSWRDVDVRMILDDVAFAHLFPDAGQNWEFDPRWLLMTIAISNLLSKNTGLPIDFQFQPQTHANERHKGPRNPIGLRFTRRQND